MRLATIRRALRASRRRGTLARVVNVTVTVVMFLLAIQLLNGATASFSGVLEGFLRSVVVDPTSALGASWLGTYLFLNGSVVAALSLALFNADLLTAAELFVMICGSRLGSAVIVMLVGVAEYLRSSHLSLRRACALGLLSFLVTASIYLPATGLGLLVVLQLGRLGVPLGDDSLSPRPFGLFDPLTDYVVATVGPGITLLLAVTLLFGSLYRFDRLLNELDMERWRRQYLVYLQSHRFALVMGLLVTMVSASVAFSLGAIVPLYNRGVVERDEIVPYILGANIGTLTDTLVIALVIDAPFGVATVVLLGLITSLLTVVAVLLYGPYRTLIDVAFERVVSSRAGFAGFLLLLLLLPSALVVAGHLW